MKTLKDIETNFNIRFDTDYNYKGIMSAKEIEVGDYFYTKGNRDISTQQGTITKIHRKTIDYDTPYMTGLLNFDHQKIEKTFRLNDTIIIRNKEVYCLTFI